MYAPGLADSVAAILCLFVIVGIEVNVVEDHHTGRGQVDTQTTCSGGKYGNSRCLVRQWKVGNVEHTHQL